MSPKRGAQVRGGTITESFGRGGKGGSRSRSRSRAGAGKAAALVGAKDAARLPKRAGGDTAPDERPDTPPHTPGTFTKEQLAEAEGRPHLDVRDTRYDALWREVQAKMGMPTHQPIHSEGMNRIEHILRVFDLDPNYGPCLGMTRLERWQRADKLGDEPPPEIKAILESREGVLDLKHSVLHDKGV